MIPEDISYEEAKDELNKLNEIGKTVDRENLTYTASEYIQIRFKNFKTMKSFGRDIYNGEITLKDADEVQKNVLVETINFKNKTELQYLENKQKKADDFST